MTEFPYRVNICYLIKGGEVLLQHKRRGFGQGKWNGVGGKIAPDESPEAGTRREVREETTIAAGPLEKVGTLEFIFTTKPEWNNYCHVYLCREFSGEPADTGEGELKWWPIDAVPLDAMWDDDRYWLPQALAGEKLDMRFYFDAEGKVIRYENV